MPSTHPSFPLAARLHRRWVASLGVQGLLLDGVRLALLSLAEQLSLEGRLGPSAHTAPLDRSPIPPTGGVPQAVDSAAVVRPPVNGTPDGSALASNGASSGSSNGISGLDKSADRTTALPPEKIADVGATEQAVSAGKLEASLMAETVAAIPRTKEGVQVLIKRLSDMLGGLDDVKDYHLIAQVDDDFYALWKELERKMQRHRQSEARLHLKDMFRI